LNHSHSRSRVACELVDFCQLEIAELVALWSLVSPPEWQFVAWNLQVEVIWCLNSASPAGSRTERVPGRVGVSALSAASMLARGACDIVTPPPPVSSLHAGCRPRRPCDVPARQPPRDGALHNCKTSKFAKQICNSNTRLCKAYALDRNRHHVVWDRNRHHVVWDRNRHHVVWDRNRHHVVWDS